VDSKSSNKKGKISTKNCVRPIIATLNKNPLIVYKREDIIVVFILFEYMNKAVEMERKSIAGISDKVMPAITHTDGIKIELNALERGLLISIICNMTYEISIEAK
jgi:hypothetical protein